MDSKMAKSPFLEELGQHMLAHHYSKRTIQSYLYWIKYYIRFHRMKHPREMGAGEVIAFLNFLANQRSVAVATQKIALNALAYLYNKYLDIVLGDLGHFNRASRQRKLPVVLTRYEVASLLSCMSGPPGLIASLIYASGLRRLEAARLRLNNIDFDHGSIRVWSGKGNKHRIVTVAPELFPRLKKQIAYVGRQLQEDRANPEYAGVWLPFALDRKYPSAG